MSACPPDALTAVSQDLANFYITLYFDTKEALFIYLFILKDLLGKQEVTIQRSVASWAPCFTSESSIIC